MFHRFHDRFGTAGVLIAVVALIAALGGTALAAGGLTSKQKKEVKAIAKSFQGTGPAGAAGANGTNGTNGAPGEKGAKGDQGIQGNTGTNGKTVLHGTGAPAAGTGTEGDFYIDTAADEIYGPKVGVGTWGAGTKLKGTTGFTETLPSGKTETGSWTARFFEAPRTEGEMPVAISFPIPLSGAGSEEKAYYCNEAQTAAGEGHCDHVGGTVVTTTGCTGNTGHPTAPAGTLCVYTSREGFEGAIHASFANFERGLLEEGYAPAGSWLMFTTAAGGSLNATGYWAVTAP